MDGSVGSGLKLGATVLITIGLISLALILFNMASGSAKSASEGYAGIEQELKQQQFIAYDDSNVSGSTVTNALRKFKVDGSNQAIGIYVKTGKSSGTWYYNELSVDGNSLTEVKNSDDLLKKAKVVTDPTYINSTGQFDSELVYDSNNVVRAITFTQK